MQRTLARWIAVFLLILSLVASASAQFKEDVTKWTYKISSPDIRAGESGQILLTATMLDGWHIYDLKKVENGPFPTSFKLESGSIATNGDAIEPTASIKKDPLWENQLIGTHEKSVTFAVPIQVKAGATGTVTGVVTATSQACDKKECKAPYRAKITIEIPVAPGDARPDKVAAVTTTPEQPAGWVEPKNETSGTETPNAPTDKSADEFTKAKESGLWSFFQLAFGAGLLALITPCVFPMIPITVSFFSKQKGGKGAQVRAAGMYCLGIIVTFTALGLGLTAAFGSSGVNKLATNIWVNAFLAILFVVLGLSLFGLFELTLPPKLLNKMDSMGRKGGFLAPVFMGATFSLTTFTCTVAFVGTLLASAAQLGPMFAIVGMVGFSSAFALPFFFFALFPSLLAKMPKSGSWLSTVKAFLGFIEIMAALKFISNVELALGLGVLTRPIFLALWATILIMAGCYLFGWFIFGHDREVQKIGWLRRGFAALSLFGALYFLNGVNGAPLGQLDSFTPPDPYPGKVAAAGTHSANWEHNLVDGKKRAESEQKLMFLNFTGVFCTNCRYMEKNVFIKEPYLAELNKMVGVELYSDRGTPEDDANLKLKIDLSKSDSLPTYVIAKADGTPLRIFQGGATTAAQQADFLKFLKGE